MIDLKQKYFFLTIIIFAVSFLQNCGSGGDFAQIKESLLEVDREFSKLSESKGMHHAFLEYMSEDCVILREGMYPVKGIDAYKEKLIRESDSKFVLTWEPLFAEVSSSGDLGYTYGIYTFEPATVHQDPIPIQGTYASIWKKDGNGNWKLVLDTGNQAWGNKTEMIEIHDAGLEHLPAITDIYNEAILNTTATFDTEIKTVDENKEWFNKYNEKYPIIVGVVNGEVVGWASLSEWSDRCAYSNTAEISIYVSNDHRSKGIGKELIKAILEKGKAAGIHTVIARIAEGSEVSIKLHERAGFRHIGVMKEVGQKFGKLLDVYLLQIIF